MTLNIKDFYSYLFQQEEGVTVAYFKTHTGTEYRVYYYPVSGYFEQVSEGTLLYNLGYFFGFTKLAPNEGKKEPLDFKIRNTILNTINEFFKAKGIDTVLLFYCDDEDGKKTKRFLCFNSWYTVSETKATFKKYDEEIVITNENGEKTDIEYLSLIVENNNPNLEAILIEFQLLKEQLIANK